MSKLYSTFKDSVNQYIKDNNIHKVEIKEPLKNFAKWLDGFQVATKDMQIVALHKSRDIDREYMQLLIDAVGATKATELALLISNRHRHYSQWQEQQSKRGAKNFHTALNFISRRYKIYAWLTWHLGKHWKRARTFGMTVPTDQLPADKEKDLNDARKNIKDTK